MTKIVFTGIEHLHVRSFERVRNVIRALEEFDPTEFISGAAMGLDTEAAYMAYEIYPKAVHRLVVPEGRHNSHLVQTWKNEYFADNMVVEYARDEPGQGSENPHLWRDTVMVRRASPSGICVAFPWESEEVMRSGTWATVRRARKAGLRIIGTPINGDSQWRENF